MRKQLVLIGGIAGSGKSTVADYISKGYPYVYVDKDDVTSTLMEELLVVFNQPFYDRESIIYVEKIRPFEYKQFLETSFHILENNYVVSAAPFLKEFQDIQWILDLNSKVTSSKNELIIIWVDAEPIETKDRLIQRGEKRDEYKLAHFDEYEQSMLTVRSNITNTLSIIKEQYNIKVHIIDNFNGSIEDTFDKIDVLIYNIND
jgi:dephospho-CoA kinase